MEKIVTLLSSDKVKDRKAGLDTLKAVFTTDDMDSKSPVTKLSSSDWNIILMRLFSYVESERKKILQKVQPDSKLRTQFSSIIRDVVFVINSAFGYLEVVLNSLLKHIVLVLTDFDSNDQPVIFRPAATPYSRILCRIISKRNYIEHVKPKLAVSILKTIIALLGYNFSDGLDENDDNVLSKRRISKLPNTNQIKSAISFQEETDLLSVFSALLVSMPKISVLTDDLLNFFEGYVNNIKSDSSSHGWVLSALNHVILFTGINNNKKVLHFMKLSSPKLMERLWETKFITTKYQLIFFLRICLAISVKNNTNGKFEYVSEEFKGILFDMYDRIIFGKSHLCIQNIELLFDCFYQTRNPTTHFLKTFENISYYEHGSIEKEVSAFFYQDFAAKVFSIIQSSQLTDNSIPSTSFNVYDDSAKSRKRRKKFDVLSDLKSALGTGSVERQISIFQQLALLYSNYEVPIEQIRIDPVMECLLSTFSWNSVITQFKENSTLSPDLINEPKQKIGTLHHESVGIRDRFLGEISWEKTIQTWTSLVCGDIFKLSSSFSENLIFESKQNIPFKYKWSANVVNELFSVIFAHLKENVGFASSEEQIIFSANFLFGKNPISAKDSDQIARIYVLLHMATIIFNLLVNLRDSLSIDHRNSFYVFAEETLLDAISRMISLNIIDYRLLVQLHNILKLLNMTIFWESKSVISSIWKCLEKHLKSLFVDESKVQANFVDEDFEINSGTGSSPPSCNIGHFYGGLDNVSADEVRVLHLILGCFSSIVVICTKHDAKLDDGTHIVENITRIADLVFTMSPKWAIAIQNDIAILIKSVAGFFNEEQIIKILELISGPLENYDYENSIAFQSSLIKIVDALIVHAVEKFSENIEINENIAMICAYFISKLNGSGDILHCICISEFADLLLRYIKLDPSQVYILKPEATREYFKESANLPLTVSLNLLHHDDFYVRINQCRAIPYLYLVFDSSDNDSFFADIAASCMYPSKNSDSIISFEDFISSLVLLSEIATISDSFRSQSILRIINLWKTSNMDMDENNEDYPDFWDYEIFGGITIETLVSNSLKSINRKLCENVNYADNRNFYVEVLPEVMSLWRNTKNSSKTFRNFPYKVFNYTNYANFLKKFSALISSWLFLDANIDSVRSIAKDYGRDIVQFLKDEFANIMCFLLPNRVGEMTEL
ncbi:hypothetical protein HK096_000438, partial [Nowakowskiella sp. JEL0078]